MTFRHNLAAPPVDYEDFDDREVSGGLGKERAGTDIRTIDDDEAEPEQGFRVRAWEHGIGPASESQPVLECEITILDDDAWPWERLDTRDNDVGTGTGRQWLDTYTDEAFAFAGVLNRSDDSQDWYGFTLTRRTELIVEFHKQHALGKAGMLQVWSGNGGVHGTVDHGEKRTFTLEPGYYELRVSIDPGAATERNYEHYDVLAKAWTDDGTEAKATDLGTLGIGTWTISGVTNEDDDTEDYYKFTLDERFRVELTHVEGAALHTEAFGQGTTSLKDGESGSKDLEPGTYYLIQTAHRGRRHLWWQPRPYESTIRVFTPQPVVTDVSVTSAPEEGDTYLWGETIEVQVTFDRNVVVSGTPTLGLTIGSDWRGARYSNGSGSKVLEFQYRIGDNDHDTDGISVRASDSAGTYGLLHGMIEDEWFGSGSPVNRNYPAQANLAGQKVDALQSGDATLSALALTHGTNPIALEPPFSADMTAYTATAGSTEQSVEMVTLTATANHDDATVAYLDTNDEALPDADVETEGHQVALSVGANTIKVEVTAENMRTQTYTVVVTRIATRPDAPRDLIAAPVSGSKVHLYWTAPLNFASSAVTGYEYRVSADGGQTWTRQWRDTLGSVPRPEITDFLVHWLDAASEYTFQVRAENPDGKGPAASVAGRAGEPHERRPTLTIEKIPGKDSVIPGRTDSGNGNTCHEDAFAHYRVRASDGDHIWLPRSQHRGIKVRVEYDYGGSVSQSGYVSQTETGLVGSNAGSLAPGNRHWDQKQCIHTARAGAGPLTVRLMQGEEYDVASPRAICIQMDREENGNRIAGASCPNALMEVADASANENTGSITFRVTLSQAAATTVTVDYATEDVTATSPLDYEARSGKLIFAAGSMEETVTVPIVDDPIEDGGETFKLVLRNVVGAVLADTEAVGTILNTEAPLLGFTLVDAATATDVGPIADGGAFTLADPANGSYGFRVETAADAQIGSVKLALVAGAKAVTQTDNLAPWSLYGDADGAVHGQGLPAGSYTLSATAHAQAGGTGAVVQTLGVSFTVTAEETPAGDALTAAFRDVPGSHGGPGSEPFTFRVLFSEAIPVSYVVLRDQGAFAVTNGSVKKAKRVDGRDDLREIHIQPSGWDAVSITLPATTSCAATGAICMDDERMLSNTETATVEGPVAIDVADAKVTEGPGATLDFVVSLSRAASGTVTVDYATADGTATEGDDYTRTEGTLTFAAGQTSKTVAVPVLDDAHDDGGETLTLVLSNAVGARIRDGEAVGTIENSDAIPKAWLARFGRTVADHVVDAVGTRLAGPAQGGSHVTLGGQRIALDGGGAPAGADAATERALAEREAAQGLASFAGRMAGASGNGAPGVSAWTRWGEEEPGGDTRTMSARELLLGSSFHLNLSGGGENAGAGDTAFVAWGGASSSRFDGEADGLVLDGEVTTFTLGADAAWSRWLAGVAVSLSEGTGSFRDHERSDRASRGSGTLESSLTGVHPYARLTLSERLSAWGLLGFGAGELTLEVDSGERWTTDTSQEMAAAGARGVLVAAPEAGGLELALRADAVVQRMRSDAATSPRLAASEAQTSRVRLMLEGSHAIAVGDGGRLVPTLEVGLRQDGGDAETGTGIELGGGLAWTDPATGLAVEAKVRGLVAHEDADYSERGASGSVRIAPGADGRGLTLTLAPAWGAAEGGAERLWSHRDARGFAPEGEAEAGSRLEAELGYGFAVFGDRGVATPHAGWSRAGESETLILGQRLQMGASRWHVAGEFAAGGRGFVAGYGYRLGDSAWRVESAFGKEERSYRAGYVYRVGDALDLSLDGRRREPANDEAPEHEIMLRAGMRW